MRYELRRTVKRSSASSALSPEAYVTIAAAQLHVPSVLFIEEQFDLLLANYIELESDLLSMAVRVMASRPDVASIQRERNFFVNRRLLNLLSACRGYLDQTPHRLNALEHDDPSAITGSDFKSYARFEYDAWLGYRVMEAMRNYTQHVGFPVEVTYQRGWVGEGVHAKHRFAVMPYIDVKMLENDFKAAVRQELKALPNKVPIMPMVRQYVACLGSIHDRVRDGLASSFDGWAGAVYDAIRRFQYDHPTERSSQLVATEVSNGTWRKTIYLDHLKRQLDYRAALFQRNRLIESLASRYVTSECEDIGKP
jgi:hypothetical protein